MLRVTGLRFNGSILLGMCGAIHLLPTYFHDTDRNNITYYTTSSISKILCLRIAGLVFNGSILLGMSGAIQLLPMPSWHRQEKIYITGY